jgi:anti-anti-sigma regulatory factor
LSNEAVSHRRLTSSAGEGSQLRVERHGAAANVWLAGQLTDATYRYLEDLLSWLVDLGCRSLDVQLQTVEQLDGACLEILRTARARLRAGGGEFTVTVRPPVSTELVMTALAIGRAGFGSGEH